MSVDTTITVSVCEVDGKETEIPQPKLTVSNHWNRSNLVVLEFNGKRVTVNAGELRRAVNNAEG